MSDTTYNVFQHYGTNAERLAFVPSPPAATKPIYVWYETDTNNVFFYTTAWHGPFAAAGGALPVHALTHASAGADPVNVTSLAGYPGTTTTFLRGDNTFATLPTRLGVIGMVIDGGASVITTGVKGFIEIPFPCTILGWTLLSSDASVLSGSIVIDIWKDTFTNYPPVVADTITAAAKPTLSAVNKNQSSTLTGWNVNVTAGDILGFNVDSVSTVTKVTLTLKIQLV